MKIIITEDQKKKLFIPRKIDEREEQLKGEIKKFLISIKDSFIWDFLGRIVVSYDFQSDHDDIEYSDLDDSYLSETGINNILNDKYGKEKGREMKIEFNKVSDMINNFILNILSGGGDITFAWGEINNNGNGELEYKESRTIKIDDIDYRVVTV